VKHWPFEERPRQEDDILPPRLILYTILGAVGVCLALSLVSFGIQRKRELVLRPSDQYPERALGPIVERSSVHEELFSELGRGQVQARAAAQSLARFGWVDRERGLVRVPIDVAMDLVVEEAKK